MPHNAASQEELTSHRMARAQAIATAGGFEAALGSGSLPRLVDATLSEIIVLGLLRQGVKVYFTVFGHGSTEIGEVLRVYQQAEVVRVYGLRSEVEASHAAMALRWVTGQKAAVVTSIGPGALQALAASIAPASDGIGVWYIFGDETTEDEGPNMQQIPRPGQHRFLRLCSEMGEAYALHTPQAVSTALRRGMNATNHPHQAGPFYLLAPMNTQPVMLANYNLEELPDGHMPRLGAAAEDGSYEAAARLLLQAERVTVKVGGGGKDSGPELLEFLELVGGVIVTNPIVPGIVPYSHPRNMSVGGSKGSLCGNYAMENADLLVAIGMRFVCQSDCSRTGFPNVRHVININTDPSAATHYNRTVALLGDAAPTLRRLNAALNKVAAKGTKDSAAWLEDCGRQRQAWEQFKAARFASPTLYDEVWGESVLTQPAAIKTAVDWARANNAVCFFDAGDVQANGFQIVEDEEPGHTFTETGASYMGFAASALLATAVADKPFYALALSGDGSFTMNPQILIDGVQHGARGCLLLLDNRRMGAISGLQQAQYGADFATSDSVPVNYLSWAGAIAGVQASDGGRSPQSLVEALQKARAYQGLSFVYVPVYYGPDQLGGMGVFGRWNVGNWCEETQALRHSIGL
jgi:3D-(3,5/4)-trihydroxycyclohexane-1,2-dione acylhydrolase (decyclizing)